MKNILARDPGRGYRMHPSSGVLSDGLSGIFPLADEPLDKGSTRV